MPSYSLEMQMQTTLLNLYMIDYIPASTHNQYFILPSSVPLPIRIRWIFQYHMRSAGETEL